MNAKIDFDTSNALAKFLSDKLKANPGTQKPAKLLHWIAEFQGFRNSRTLKEAPSPVVLEGAVRMDFSQGGLVTLNPYQTETPSNTWGPSAEDARIAMAYFIRARVEAFFMDRIESVKRGVRRRLITGTISLPDYLYHLNWAKSQTPIFGLVNSDHVWAAKKGVKPAAFERARLSLERQCRACSDTNVIEYLYEEIARDVLIALLGDLEETCNSEVTTEEDLTDVYEIRERIKSVTDPIMFGWMGAVA